MSGKSLGTLTLDLVTRTAGFSSGIGRAEREISRWGKSISREMASASRDVRSALADISGQITSLRTVASGVTGALAGAFTAGNLIAMADSWASVNAALKQATQSTTEFSSSQQALMDISQRTGTAFKDSAALFTRASASLREYGYGADDVLKVTEAISTGLKLSGAGAAETSSVITQFSQALAAGVLRGQDFNSVNQNGDRIIRALAAGLGVARKDLKALADQGKLTTDTVVPALISQLDTLRDEYAAVPDSVSGSITKVENALMAWAGGANDASGATRTLSGVLDAVAENMDGVATAAGVMVAVGVSRWAGSLVSGAVSAGAALVKTAADEKALAEAQVQGTKAATARAQAAVYRAQKALAAADSAEKQAAAEKRLAIAQATLTRNTEARAAAQAKLNSLTSTGNRLLSGVSGLVVGIPGLVMLGATAWYTLYRNQEQARESARQYADTLPEIVQQIPQMTLPEASDNLDRTRDALTEQNRLVDEQQEKVAALQKKVEDLQYAAQNGGSNGALSWAGMSDAALMNGSYITRFLTPAETATRELEEATAQLATEQARLTQMQEKSQSVQDAMASLEQRRTDLIRQQAAEENREYQSLLMMNGAHTEFNRLLGLGNDLLQQRQGLGSGSVPLRLPQAELDDKQQKAMEQMRQQLALSKLKGADRERARLGYAADALGLGGDAYQTARIEYISAGMDAWQNSQSVKKTGKSEAEKTEETYRRMIAQQKEQLALAGQDTELAKVKYRISQGELATLTETQKQTLLNHATELDQLKAKQKALEEQKQLAEFTRSQQEQTRNMAETLETDFVGAGAGEQTRQRMRELLELQRQYYEQSEQLRQRYESGDITQVLYEDETAVLKAELDKRLQLKKAYYAKSDAMNAEWLNGARDALADYTTAAADNATLAQGAVSSVLQSTQGSVQEALDGIIYGTESAADALKDVVKGLGDAIIQQFGQIAAQKIVAGVFGGTFGTATSGSGGLLSLLTGSSGTATGMTVAPAVLTAGSSATGMVSSSVSSLTGSGCCCCNSLNSLTGSSGTGSSGGILSGVSDFLNTPLTDIFSDITDSLTDVFSGLTDTMSSLISGFGSDLSGMLSGLFSGSGSILSSLWGLSGMAHDGIDSVPATGTWLLQKGERVLTSGTSAKLDRTLEAVGNTRSSSGYGAGMNYAPVINVSGDPDAKTLRMLEQAVQRGAQKGYQMVADSLNSGSGAVHSAVNTRYARRRSA